MGLVLKIPKNGHYESATLKQETQGIINIFFKELLQTKQFFRILTPYAELIFSA